MYAIRSYYVVCRPEVHGAFGLSTGLEYNPMRYSSEDEVVELALARIRQLAAHEVGHTLGLAHNVITSYSIHYTKLYERSAPSQS